MKKILSILTVGCALTLSSCEDWLDKYPLAQMSPETFFSNENELQAFSNKFYTVFPSDGLYNEYWDNIIHNDLPQEMRGGRSSARGYSSTSSMAAGHGPTCAISTRCSNTRSTARTSTSVTTTTRWPVSSAPISISKRSSGSATCRGMRNRSARPMLSSIVRAIRENTSCSA